MEAWAASSLFIAARFRTGPACLSQDPAVDPLTTASEWLTGSKRRTTRLRGRERGCEEKKRKKLYPLAQWQSELGNNKRKNRGRKKNERSIPNHSQSILPFPSTTLHCAWYHAHRKQKQRLEFYSDTGFFFHCGFCCFISAAKCSLSAIMMTEQIHPQRVLHFSSIN